MHGTPDVGYEARMDLREKARLAAPKLKCHGCKSLKMWSRTFMDNKQVQFFGRCSGGMMDIVDITDNAVSYCTEFKRI